MSLRFETYIGAEITPILSDVARLRIAVFRDWPYLYDGDHAYEERYLATYAASAQAVVVAAYAGAELVGASTGLPLAEASPEFQAAFTGQPYAVADIFYCAESVLLPEYRGQGAGHTFFEQRESFARAHGFGSAAFCSVERPDDQAARPAAYRALDPFWRARGYMPLPGAVAHYAWADIGATTETPKPLQFWIRAL